MLAPLPRLRLWLCYNGAIQRICSTSVSMCISFPGDDAYQRLRENFGVTLTPRRNLTRRRTPTLRRALRRTLRAIPSLSVSLRATPTLRRTLRGTLILSLCLRRRERVGASSSGFAAGSLLNRSQWTILDSAKKKSGSLSRNANY